MSKSLRCVDTGFPLNIGEIPTYFDFFKLIVSFSISKLSLPPIEIVTYNLNWHLSNWTWLL